MSFRLKFVPLYAAIWTPYTTWFVGPTRVQIRNGISIGSAVFGRPFVKRFALCYRTVALPVCLSVLSCLSVTLVYCGQTVGKLNLTWRWPRPRPHCVEDGGPSPPSPQKGAQPQFSAHVRCGQTAGCIRIPFGTEYTPRPRRHCVRWGSSSL